MSIENLGTAGLVVSNFSSGCGCLVPGEGSFTVAPRSSIEIPLSLQTFVAGPKNARLTFETNDPRMFRAGADIHWSVESSLSFGQDAWDLGEYAIGDSIVAALPMVSNRSDISDVQETLVAEIDPPVNGLESRLLRNSLNIFGTVTGDVDTARITSNVVIRERKSTSILLVMPIRILITEELEFWPETAEVEWDKDRRPYVKFVVNRAGTILDKLSFMDQEGRPLVFNKDDGGTSNQVAICVDILQVPNTKSIRASISFNQSRSENYDLKVAW